MGDAGRTGMAKCSSLTCMSLFPVELEVLTIIFMIELD